MFLGIAAAAFPRGEGDEWTILVGGDTDGYLSPCGCTKPMTGGIKRRASAVHILRTARTLVLENGGLVAGNGRQDELKAETMAQFVGSIDADAVHVTPSETRLGKGEILALENLAGDRLLSTSLENADLPFKPYIAKGPFLVGGVSMNPAALGAPLGLTAASPESSVTRFVNEAETAQRAPILLLSGTLADARAVAKRNPSLALVVYRSSGTVGERPEKEGKTWLVSPGDRGKALVRLTYANGSFRIYNPIHLGPDYDDEAAVTRAYRAYLKRVEDEGLLDRLPRSPTASYAGSVACAACHTEEFRIWKYSRHAKALASLEREGHGRDPDCVRCHVVGLDSTKGFRRRASTPQFANVGCESCHGPALAHVKAPETVHLTKVEPRQCVSCHDPENSPNFQFLTFWPKVKHGNGEK